MSTRREIAYFKTESLSLLGADPNFTELRGPLVAPGSEELAADAVSRRLADEGEWDWIQWSGIQGPFGEALGAMTSLASAGRRRSTTWSLSRRRGTRSAEG